MSSTEIRGKIMVTVELPIHYVVRIGMYPMVMEAHLSGTYYPLTVLPPDAQERIFNAAIEAAQEEAADRALDREIVNWANAEGRDA